MTGFFDDAPVIPGFTVEEELGRGSQARVFRARQDAMDRVVALKVIPGPTSDEGLRRTLRLFREARVLGALDHPGIVRGIDAGSTPECSWFAMEYVEGRTLAAILAEDGPPPVARAVALGLDLLDALDHAHRRGVVHRDLKPSNILVDRGGRARVLDLGLARREADPRQSLDGGALGTPKYMAPEQARTPEHVDGRADLFALAGVLYTAISGQAPFEGRTVAEVLTRVLYDDPTPLASLRLDVPDALSAVIEKALAKNPDHRFQDAAAFGAALRAAMRPGATTRSSGAPRRRPGDRRVAFIVAIVACGLAAVALVFLEGRSRERGGQDPGPGATSRRAIPVESSVPSSAETVVMLVPPLLPDLAPLERAVRACGAAQSGFFEPADLAACFAPLKLELEAAADRFRQNVAATARGGDAMTAREMLRRAGGALLRETSPDGVDPPAAIRRLAADVAAQIGPRFEREFATWQEDLAADCLRNLDQLAADAAAADWSPATQSDRLAMAVRGASALEGAVRERVDRRRQEVARALRQRPVDGFQRRLLEAEAMVGEGRVRTARAALAPWAAGQGEELVPGSTASVRVILALADKAEAAAVDLALDAQGILARGDSQALGPDERSRQATELRRRVDSAKAAVAEMPRLGDAVLIIEPLSAAADEAAGLRAALLSRLGAGPPADEPFRLVTRKDGAIAERRLVGREGGGVVLRKPVDGESHTVPVEDLSAGCVADALGLFGARPSPAVVALLDYWDGDDASALARAEAVPAGAVRGVRDRVAALAAASLETVAARLGTEAERKALAVLIDARRRRAEGDLRGAADRLLPLAADRKLRATLFWRRYGEEAERVIERARRAEERAAKLRPYGATAQTYEPKRKSVRLMFDFRAEGIAEGATPPKGAVRDAAGLRWPGSAAEPGVLPEQCAPLRIGVPPEVAQSAVSVRCELLLDPKHPPSFVAASWFDASFLAFGSLRDFGAFAGVPLHGLERDLLRAKDVDRGVCWFGGTAEARRRLVTDGLPLREWSGRKKVIVGFDVAQDGTPFAVFDEMRFPARGARPKPAGFAGLEIRLPPAVTLVSATLEFPLAETEDG